MKYKILDRKNWYSRKEKKHLYKNSFYLPANMVGVSHIKVSNEMPQCSALDIFISLLNTEHVDKIQINIQYGNITVKRFKGNGGAGIDDWDKTLGTIRIKDLATMLGQC
jgi:hypothetical protein